VFVVDTTGGAASLSLAEELRSSGLRVDRAYGHRSMKAQMKLADRSGALIALIIGPKELEGGTVTMRHLRGEDHDQQVDLARGEVVATLRQLIDDRD
jgi:histidyl-tRNA synthetase